MTRRNSFMTPVGSVASAAGGSAYRELETTANYELLGVGGGGGVCLFVFLLEMIR